MAHDHSRNADEFAQETNIRCEESWFIEAVLRGEEALARGEFLTHEQMGQKIQEWFRS